MKKLWLLTTLLICSLLLFWCENSNTNLNDNEFISYYDNWAIRQRWAYIDWMKQWAWITYDEWWNVISIEEYKDWELVNYEPESNILSVEEGKILSIDELKNICEDKLKDIEPNNLSVTRTEEKLFINTYWFKWITKSDWIHNDSPTYCNITLDWLVLSNWFYRDQWQTIDQLHEEMDFNNVWWIGNVYPNLKEFYWFVWNIVLGDIYQTTYITWKNTLYFDNYRWIALKIWEEFDWWLIREIDTDEEWYPHSEIIFLIKGEDEEKNRTWIDWYREIFAIKAIGKQVLEDFHITPDFTDSIIWWNNQYYFTETKTDLFDNSYSGLTFFDVEDRF